MTREQAIETYLKAGRIDNLGSIQHQLDTGRLIDGMAALGLIKLDEPKCATERGVAAMFKMCSYGGLITPRHAIEALDEAGLKIVEK